MSITFDSSSVKRLNKRIEKLGAMDKQELLSAIGSTMEYQTHNRSLHEKTSPDGTPWVPRSDDYAKTRHGSHSFLMGDGHLEHSIQFLVAGDSAEIGTNLPYAALQQFGGEEISRPGHPAGEYLALSDDNWNDIAAVVDDLLDDLIQGAMQ